MNAVMTVLDAIGKQGEVTRIGLEAQIALEAGDTPRASTLFHQAAEMMESAVGSLKKASERDLARFLAATHYYKGGRYEQAARVCKTIQEKRLPSNVRHLYPPFLKNVKERSTPDYAERYRRQVEIAYKRAVKGRDRAAAQEVIEILREHSYLIPRDQMASEWAECCEVLGRQRAASLFYRDGLAVQSGESELLVLLSRQPRQGRTARGSLVDCRRPACEQSWRAILRQRHARHQRHAHGDRQNMSGMDEHDVKRRRVELLKHFESALKSYRISGIRGEGGGRALDGARLHDRLRRLCGIEGRRQSIGDADRWIELRPDSPYPHVLRGMMTYPGDAANADFREAIRFEQSPDPYPYYFLAHEALKSGDFPECDHLSTLALERNPSRRIFARHSSHGRRSLAGISVAPNPNKSASSLMKRNG